MSTPTSDWILSRETIDLGIERPRCHASTICETPEGLAVAFFGASDDGTADHVIWLARLSAGRW